MNYTWAMDTGTHDIATVSIIHGATILVIDDSGIRQDWFKENLADHHKAFNSLEAELYLKKFKYDVIFLDNDLGSEKEGWQLVPLIKETQEQAMIIVISNNPVAAKRITDELPNSQWLQYGSFNLNIWGV